MIRAQLGTTLLDSIIFKALVKYVHILVVLTKRSNLRSVYILNSETFSAAADRTQGSSD